LRPHSFAITFILHHGKMRLFRFTKSHFYGLAYTSLRESWSFARRLFIWSFARLRPSVSTLTHAGL